MTTLSTIVMFSRSKSTGYVEDFFFTGSAVHLRTGSSTCNNVIQLLSQNFRVWHLCHSKLSFTAKTPMCADECLRDSNPKQLIHDLTAYLEPSLCERWSMQIFKWRIHNPPRVDMIKSSAQLAKPCNADLGGIPKVEKLERGQLKSWPNGSFAEKIEWGKPSIIVGLILTVSICTTNCYYRLNYYYVKTNIVSPAKQFAFLANGQ